MSREPVPNGCQWATEWNPYYDCDRTPAVAIGRNDDDADGIRLCRQHVMVYVRFNRYRGARVERLPTTKRSC